MRIRVATPVDAPAIAALVNTAYEVERFFVAGSRTSADKVREAMSTGTFLTGWDEDGRLVATVHVEVQSDGGTFGMLAVDPAAQRQGWGRALIEAAEDHACRAGCRWMEIRVVNVREDLLPRYRRFGYVETGVEPYDHRPTTRPCHFVVMKKALAETSPPA